MSAGRARPDPVIDHRRAVDLFSHAVARAAGQWESPSPCEGWTARDVVEHVIGFHEVLVLRPLGVRVQRPRDDVSARWAVTAGALVMALAQRGVLDREVEVPGAGATSLRRLVPTLTIELLVHSWDISKAVDAAVPLPSDLVETALARVSRHADSLAASALYAPALLVPDDADPQTRFLALLGRRA